MFDPLTKNNNSKIFYNELSFYFPQLKGDAKNNNKDLFFLSFLNYYPHSKCGAKNRNDKSFHIPFHILQQFTGTIMVKTVAPKLRILLYELYHNETQQNKYIAFAESLLNNKTNKNFALPYTPEGVCSTVYLKLMAGKFVWNNEKYSLNTIIYFRIRSEVQNIVKKEKHFIPIPWDDYEVTCEDFDDNIDAEFDEKFVESGKNKILPVNYFDDPFENEYDDHCISFIKIEEDVFEALKDSDLEFKVAEKMFQYIKPKEIALSLGISTDQVHNIKRRIYRIVRNLYTPDKNKKYIFTYKRNNGGCNVYIN
jgi:hypothetical protein